MAEDVPADDEAKERRVFNRRALLLGAVQAGAFGVLGARLYQLQVLDAHRYAPLADENRFNTLPLAPLRGRIFDRFGVMLASNEEAFRVWIVPSLAADLAATLDKLEAIVPLSADDRARLIARARRQPVSLPIVVASDLTWDQVARLNLYAPDLPGVETEAFGRRRYHHGRAVSHVIGHVGAVERFGMGDDPMLRIPGVRVGRTGVERGMEAVLRGKGGTVQREVDARGRIVRNLARIEPVAGRDVVTTIDLELQSAVLARLGQERRAAAVVLDIATGEVVALASTPTYDAADPSTIVTASPVAPRLRASSRAGLLRPRARDDHPLVNRATTGLYPPGSTFKIATALAGLDAGVVDLRERINCEGSYVYFDRTFRCWNRGGHGRCDLHRALRESCDVYFYEVARRLGMDALAAGAARLGLGQTFQAGIAPQAAGVVPTPAWKRGRLGKSWLGGETLLAGIGQGYVLSTPLQLAVMTARVASGTMVEPTLVRPSGTRPGAPFARLASNDRWLAAIRRGLKAVVNEPGGTGTRASLGEGGPEIAGKTGTSQVSRRSTDRVQEELRWEDRDHALFVGYFPADAPRYAVAAVIEHGGGGGGAAAPLVRDVIQSILARDPMQRPAFQPSPGPAAAELGSGAPAGPPAREQRS